jgi:hypothetical protein
LKGLCFERYKLQPWDCFKLSPPFPSLSMAFPNQFSSIQTAFEDDSSKDSHWALNVALAGNTEYDRYNRFPSVPVQQPSDVADYPSDDEDDLDPYGIYSSYSYDVYPGSFRHVLHPFYSKFPHRFVSTDFDEPYLPPGNLYERGHDVALFREEQPYHPHYPEFSSTTSDGFDISDWVYESSDPEASTSDAITPSSSSSSTHVETYHDGSGSDEDAEGEFEHCPSDDVDEYLPDLEIPTSKKRRANSQSDRFTSELASSSSSSSSSWSSSSSSASSFSSSTSSPSSSRSLSGSSNSSNKRARLSFPSRNLQGTATKSLRKVNKPDPWACPVENCRFVQHNHRKPDLRRHIKTHAPSGEWVCCGVPVELGGHYGLSGSERRHVFRGRDMIDGCLKSFSRKDALRRHLANKNVRCVGDVQWCSG